MQEHRAAAAGHPRAGIVVDLDDEIVEMVVPPQPVAWFSGRAAEGAVIAPVGGIFAPGNVTGNASDGQQCPRPRMPVRPVAIASVADASIEDGGYFTRDD